MGWDERGKKKREKKEKSRSDPRYEQADNHHRSFVILLRDKGKRKKKSLARILGVSEFQCRKRLEQMSYR